eukprot:scaffold7781_cov57-Phaeocystis_antarctica.AAC.3
MSSTPMSLSWSASASPPIRVAPTHSRPTNDVVKPATEYGDEVNTHYSRLTTHDSRLTTHDSRLTTHHSPLSTYYLPRTMMRPSLTKTLRSLTMRSIMMISTEMSSDCDIASSRCST